MGSAQCLLKSSLRGSGPLRSGVWGSGPAVLTDIGIWSSQLRSGSATAFWGSLLGEEGCWKEEVTVIKSRDPHLAGGEKENVVGNGLG